jgi:Trk K+ transport system NAD-binding subunit
LDFLQLPSVSIITVVEKGGERRINPASGYVFKPESQIALAGNRKDVREFVDFIEKGPK